MGDERIEVPLDIALWTDFLWLFEYIANRKDPRVESKILPDTLEKVIYRCSPPILEFLLSTRCFNSATEEMVHAATENQQNGQEMMKILLGRCNLIKITESMVETVARNFPASLVEKFLDCVGNVHISQDAVEAAAENSRYGLEVVTMLLGKGGNIKITMQVIKAASRNKGCGNEVIEVLLRGDCNIVPNDLMAETVARHFSASVIELFLMRVGDTNISQGTMEAAAENLRSGVEVVQVLLRRGDIGVTAEVLEAAARSGECGQHVLELLASNNSQVSIAEQLVDVAARNHLCRNKLMEVLLSRSADIKPTERVVETVVQAFNAFVMEMFLDMVGDGKITQRVVEAAVQNSVEVVKVLMTAAERKISGIPVMEMLLHKNPDIKVTQELLQVASTGQLSGAPMIEMLLEHDLDATVTADVFHEADGNWDLVRLMIEMQLCGNAGATVTNETIRMFKAVGAEGESSKERLEMWLNTEPDITVTEKLIAHAVRNWTGDIEVMEMLLRR